MLQISLVIDWLVKNTDELSNNVYINPHLRMAQKMVTLYLSRLFIDTSVITIIRWYQKVSLQYLGILTHPMIPSVYELFDWFHGVALNVLLAMSSSLPWFGAGCNCCWLTPFATWCCCWWCCWWPFSKGALVLPVLELSLFLFVRL